VRNPSARFGNAKPACGSANQALAPIGVKEGAQLHFGQQRWIGPHELDRRGAACSAKANESGYVGKHHGLAPGKLNTRTTEPDGDRLSVRVAPGQGVGSFFEQRSRPGDAHDRTRERADERTELAVGGGWRSSEPPRENASWRPGDGVQEDPPRRPFVLRLDVWQLEIQAALDDSRWSGLSSPPTAN
jgi:hypothetical protein